MLVVGAIGKDRGVTGVDGNHSNNSEIDSGAAYVFVREAEEWAQQAYLKALNTVSISSGFHVIWQSGLLLRSRFPWIRWL